MMEYEYANDLIVCAILLCVKTNIPTFVLVDTCVKSGCHALDCIATIWIFLCLKSVSTD